MTTPDTTFKFDKHADGLIHWEPFCTQLRIELQAGSVAWLLIPEEVTRHTPVDPGAFTWMGGPALDLAGIQALSNPNLSRYNRTYTAFAPLVKKYQKTFKTFTDAGQTGLAIIKRLLTADCVAFTQVVSLEEDCATRAPSPASPVIFQEAMRLLSAHFAPTQHADVQHYLNQLSTLRADDGRGFQRYRQDVEHALRSLPTASRFPDSRTLLSFLAEGVQGLPWAHTFLDQYLNELDVDGIAGAAVPAIARHVTFLDKCSEKVDNFPQTDVIGKAKPNIYSHSPICLHCSCSHPTAKCRQAIYGGTCLCGFPITRGSTTPGHNVMDAKHKKLRAGASLSSSSKKPKRAKGKQASKSITQLSEELAKLKEATKANHKANLAANKAATERLLNWAAAIDEELGTNFADLLLADEAGARKKVSKKRKAAEFAPVYNC